MVFKKIMTGLTAILLSASLGCKSVPSESLERKVERPNVALNSAGGFLTYVMIHESSHALICLSYGGEVKTFKPFPNKDHGYCGGYMEYGEVTKKEEAMINIAGPLSNVILSETINYNLRNGNISESHQPFWATTSLMSRISLLLNAKRGLQSGEYNEFDNIERTTDISVEDMFLLVALYTGLNCKNIAKEFRVAIGRGYYPEKKGKSSIEFFPNYGGGGLVYRLKF